MGVIEYRVDVERLGDEGSAARAKEAEVILDTATEGRADALAPPELLLASLGACMVRGIQRLQALVSFKLEGAQITFQARRADDPPRIERIDYDVAVRGDLDEDQLEVIHQNLRRFSTIYNTIAAGTELEGRVRLAD